MKDRWIFQTFTSCLNGYTLLNHEIDWMNDSRRREDTNVLLCLCRLTLSQSTLSRSVFFSNALFFLSEYSLYVARSLSASTSSIYLKNVKKYQIYRYGHIQGISKIYEEHMTRLCCDNRCRPLQGNGQQTWFLNNKSTRDIRGTVMSLLDKAVFSTQYFAKLFRHITLLSTDLQ
jgi:hypothetical protein